MSSSAETLAGTHALPHAARASAIRIAGAGAAAGAAAALVFASAHALIIVPIWSRMMGGVMFAVLAGIAAAFGFVHLGFTTFRREWTSHMRAGARYGALLWLAVAPVTLVDSALRLLGVPRALELVNVALAVLVAIAMGGWIGWRRRHVLRDAALGAGVTLLLVIAMAGPVPLPNGPRAMGIFVSVLPAAILAGVVLALSLRVAEQQRVPDETVRRA